MKVLAMDEASMSQPGCGVEKLEQDRSRLRKHKILLPSYLVVTVIMISVDIIKKQYLKKNPAV